METFSLNFSPPVSQSRPELFDLSVHLFTEKRNMSMLQKKISPNYVEIARQILMRSLPCCHPRMLYSVSAQIGSFAKGPVGFTNYRKDTLKNVNI